MVFYFKIKVNFRCTHDCAETSSFFNVLIFLGLYFIVHGVAQSHWAETRTKTSGSLNVRKNTAEKIQFKGEQVYLNQKTWLFGGKGCDLVEMDIGTYKYEFECHLPSMLPSSLEIAHGHIRYKVKAVLGFPQAEKEFSSSFQVVRSLDSKECSEIQLPLKFETVESFGFLYWASMPLILTVALPCSGFIPGETVPISIKYNNQSKNEVLQTAIVFRRIIQYTSFNPEQKTKSEVQRIFESTFEGVGGVEERSMEKSFVLPTKLLESNSQYCNVIQIRYELKVKAKLKLWHKNIELVIPIKIISAQKKASGGSPRLSAIRSHNNAARSSPLLATARNGPEQLMTEKPTTAQHRHTPIDPIPLYHHVPRIPIVSSVPSTSLDVADPNDDPRKSFLFIFSFITTLQIYSILAPSFDEAMKMSSPIGKLPEKSSTIEDSKAPSAD